MRTWFILILLMLLLPSAAAECTIGLALGSATTDGRPVIFKNRDITSWSLEYKTFTPSGLYAYVGNRYTNSSTIWMGANEVGLGVVQSAAYNVSTGGSGLDNGSMISYALARCLTVDDFEQILIDTNGGGRSTAANYAVIDAYGNGAMFECSPWIYQRYDPDENGIVVRANFCYIGDSGRVGQNLQDRAFELMSEEAEGDYLDSHYIAKHVVSDLLYPDQDPYPLPWTGTFGSMPARYVNTGPFTGVQTICNYNTRACAVVQGVPAGSDPANTVLWSFFGQPVLSIPVPIFPASHDEPSVMTGSPAPLCYLAQGKSQQVFDHYTSYYLNTAQLLDEAGGGYWTFIHPTIDWVFDDVSAIITEWETSPPTESERIDYQENVATQIYEIYESETAMASVDQAMPLVSKLRLYPNPFTASCRISCSRPDEALSNIEIFDTSGRRITSSVTDFNWRPASSIEAGVYLVRAYLGDRELTERVVMLK